MVLNNELRVPCLRVDEMPQASAKFLAQRYGYRLRRGAQRWRQAADKAHHEREDDPADGAGQK